MDDIRTASAPPKCGSNGITSTGYYLPKLMEETMGTRFDIVLGYQSGGDVDLRWNAVKCSAELLRSPLISPASLSSPGASAVSLTP